MPEKLKSNPETEKPEVDSKKLGEVAILAAKMEELAEVEFRDDVRFWAEQYRDTEIAFSKKNISKAEEFEIWEADAKNAFDKMTEAERYANYRSIYEKDDEERIAKIAGAETIEAKSGEYYHARNAALLDAIDQNTDENERAADEKVVLELHELAARHIEAIFDYDTRGTDPMIYNMNRRTAHNSLIRGVNEINHLAEKYGVKRLVFRDFETNDFTYNSVNDPHGETNARAEYDRSSVEAWVRNAFSRDFEQAEKERNFTSRRNDSIVAMFHGGV